MCLHPQEHSICRLRLSHSLLIASHRRSCCCANRTEQSEDFGVSFPAQMARNAIGFEKTPGFQRHFHIETPNWLDPKTNIFFSMKPNTLLNVVLFQNSDQRWSNGYRQNPWDSQNSYASICLLAFLVDEMELNRHVAYSRSTSNYQFNSCCLELEKLSLLLWV